MKSFDLKISCWRMKNCWKEFQRVNKGQGLESRCCYRHDDQGMQYSHPKRQELPRYRRLESQEGIKTQWKSTCLCRPLVLFALCPLLSANRRSLQVSELLLYTKTRFSCTFHFSSYWINSSYEQMFVTSSKWHFRI